MKWNNWWIGTGVILALALLLRVWGFGQIPIGLNRDEAALAYNAFSIGKTGRDEHGVRWPVSILSFGDQKLPGYVYTLVPLVGTFGLHPWVARLPSLIAGLVNIFLLGKILQIFLVHQKRSQQNLLSWLGMLTMAVSPWAIHFSRVAYEANLATCFFLAGLLSFLMCLDATKGRQRWLLLFTALSLNLSLLTYHSYQVFLPLLLVGVVVIYGRKILEFDRLGLLGGILLTLLTFLLFWQGGILQANSVKGSGLTLLTGQHLSLAYTPERAALNWLPPVLQKLAANKATAGMSVLTRNWIQVWSPGWLFVTGSDHSIHNPGHMNNLPLWSLPLMVLGLLYFWNNRKLASMQLLLVWLIAASLVPALTIVPQHTTRAIALFPALSILVSLGLAELWNVWPLTNKIWKIVLPGFLVVIVWSTLLSFPRYLTQYTRLDPQARQDQYHHLAQALARYQAQSYQVITQSPSSSPYIWYLLETKYDPTKYFASHENYPADVEGFVHVKRIENIFFETLNWDDVESRATSGLMTLILKPGEMPDSNLEKPQYHRIETIRNQEGTTEYEVWQVAENR
jgi:hypothetical protein